jgi:hypothetical protein
MAAFGGHVKNWKMAQAESPAGGGPDVIPYAAAGVSAGPGAVAFPLVS